MIELSEAGGNGDSRHPSCIREIQDLLAKIPQGSAIGTQCWAETIEEMGERLREMKNAVTLLAGLGLAVDSPDCPLTDHTRTLLSEELGTINGHEGKIRRVARNMTRSSGTPDQMIELTGLLRDYLEEADAYLFSPEELRAHAEKMKELESLILQEAGAYGNPQQVAAFARQLQGTQAVSADPYKPKVYYAFSELDKHYRDIIRSQLHQMERLGYVESSRNRSKGELHAAQIVLCLMSRHLLADPFWQAVELPELEQRMDGLWIFPVRVGPIAAAPTIFNGLKNFPPGRRSIAELRANAREGQLAEIVRELKRVVEHLRGDSKSAPP